MVSRQRVRQAVREVAPREDKGRLLSFLTDTPDHELTRWDIEDEDDNETIYDFLFIRSKGAAGLMSRGGLGWYMGVGAIAKSAAQ